MARNWHAKGGRFKKGAFGDLGLRAYKDQQDRIIQHQKDQNRQEQLYSQEYLRQLEGSGAKQIEHNRMLQGLEVDVSNLAIQNTKIRGDREVDAIKGQAKEAEKQAKFWEAFSTTYSKQYAEVAGGLWDIHTTKQMHQQMDLVTNHPGHQKSINEFAVLNDISDINQLNEQYDIYRDKSLTPSEQAERLGHAVDLNLRMNHKTKLAVAKKILNDWPTQREMLRELAIEKGIDFNEETISKFFYIRARSLLQQHGISHTSKAGQLLLKGVQEQESQERTTLFQQTLVRNDEDKLNKLKERNHGLVGKVQFTVENGEISARGDYYNSYATDLNQRVIFESKRWRLGPNNTIIKPSILKPNLKDDFELIGEQDIKANVFKSKTQMLNHLLNSPIPGAKALRCEADGTLVYAEKDTWGGKHPDLALKLSNLWDENEAEKHKKSQKSLEAENASTVAEILRRSQLKPDDPEYIDIGNKEELSAIGDQYSHLTDVQDLVGDFEAFNQLDKNQSITNTHLVDLLKNNDIENLSEYILHLKGDHKTNWNNRLRQVRALHRNGLDRAGLRKEATAYVSQIVKSESLEKLQNNPHFSDMIDLVEQEILFQFDSVFDQKISDREKLVAVDKAIREQMQLDKTGSGPRGLGIFRRVNEAAKTRFLATWEEDDKPHFSEDDIKLKLKSAEDFNTLFSELNNTQNKGKVNLTKNGSEIHKFLIDIDDADKALRHVKAGGKIPQNDVVDYIYTKQPKVDDKKLYSKRDIWNNIFKSMGINDEIPEGANEFNSYTIEKSDISADASKHSEEDQQNIAIYCKLREDGICIDGQQTKESKDVETKNQAVQRLVLTADNEEEWLRLNPGSHILKQGYHWWQRPWAEKRINKSSVRLNRI